MSENIYITPSDKDSFIIESGINLEKIVKWVSRHFTPEQVFASSRLEAWAFDNDFEKIKGKTK